MECCILYTVKYRLSPGWNQVGNVLVANVDFLVCCGKIEAVSKYLIFVVFLVRKFDIAYVVRCFHFFITKERNICEEFSFEYGPLAQLLRSHVIGAGGLGFKSRVGQIGAVSPTTRHFCDVLSKLCSPGAKPQRWAQPLVTRFSVIPRV